MMGISKSPHRSLEARDEMTGTDHLERRLRGATVAVGKRAAIREPASRNHDIHAEHVARNDGKALGSPGGVGQRLDQSARVGMERRCEQLLGWRSLYNAARLHHDD